MKAFLAGKIIVSPWVVFAILLIVAVGYGIVNVIANRKWGYSKKKEEDIC